MRVPPSVLVLVMSITFGVAAPATAQSPGPAIHNVTVQPDAGVLTITGTDLGANLIVTIDGQPVTVLPGATATRVEVQPPATLLTTAGTYRLTVVDPVRHVGDGFVVASQGSFAGGVIEAGRTPSTSAVGASSAVSEVGRASTAETAANARQLSAPSPMVIEGPSNTAIGIGALGSNTTGLGNTASGAWVLGLNTTGSYNTAAGDQALYWNTTGQSNSATGYRALFSNVSGHVNTASGDYSLFSNTTGSANTATGDRALYSNTIGRDNTGIGGSALGSNTTGSNNVAVGTQALVLNTSGRYNTAIGWQALDGNTIGIRSVALGTIAGGNATTGSYNVFLGADVTGTAADTNTIRIGLPYDASNAIGQNQTFIAGIHGTQLTGPAVQVFIDANGQLGTLTAPIASGTVTVGALAAPPQAKTQTSIETELRGHIARLDATNAQLRARLARLEAMMAKAAVRK